MAAALTLISFLNWPSCHTSRRLDRRGRKKYHMYGAHQLEVNVLNSDLSNRMSVFCKRKFIGGVASAKLKLRDESCTIHTL